MRRHIITMTTIGLLLVGCSGESSSDAKPKATKTATIETENAPSPKLSEEWGPKLEAATGKGKQGVCKVVGTDECVAHVTTLTEVVYDVETAIQDAGAEDDYPKTMDEIAKVTEASEGYASEGCQGSTEKALEASVCSGYTGDLIIGPASVMLAMETDELGSE